MEKWAHCGHWADEFLPKDFALACLKIGRLKGM